MKSTSVAYLQRFISMFVYYAHILTGIIIFRRISNLFTQIGEIQVYDQNEFYQLLKTMELLGKTNVFGNISLL